MAGDVSLGVSQMPPSSLSRHWEGDACCTKNVQLSYPICSSQGEPRICYHVLAEGTFSSAAAKSDSQWPSVTVWTFHECHFWALILQWGTRLCQDEPRLPCSPGKWQNEVFASKTEGHFYFFLKPLFSSLFYIRVFPAHVHRFAFTFFGCSWGPRKWGSSHSCFFGFLFSLVVVYWFI